MKKITLYHEHADGRGDEIEVTCDSHAVPRSVADRTYKVQIQ